MLPQLVTKYIDIMYHASCQAFIEYQMASMTRALCTQIGNFNTSDLTELDDLPIQ